jgi:hypothetical protein
MSSSHTPPIAKAPAERTLFVAVVVLILVAVVQLIAAGLALAPRLDFEKWARAMAPRQSAAAAAPVATSAAPASADNSAQVNKLLVEAQTFRDDRPANYHGALEAVTEADRLSPNNIGILSAMANDAAMAGENAKLVEICKRIVALPPSGDPNDAKVRALAQNVLTQTGNTGAVASNATAAPAAAPKDSSGARDEVGIPIGSVMGIVDVKLVNGEPGQKNLRVSTKGASSQKVDPMKFNATVDFYEQDDHGQIVHNDSPSPFEWLSGPAVDWANGDPEIFQVKYRMPLEDRGDLPPMQYFGYVVAIYYDGELQDQRADPPSLLNDHAPALHKDIPTE